VYVSLSVASTMTTVSRVVLIVVYSRRESLVQLTAAVNSCFL